jgi:hypothetical protein
VICDTITTTKAPGITTNVMFVDMLIRGSSSVISTPIYSDKYSLNFDNMVIYHLYPFLMHVVFITRIVICVLYYSIEGFAGVSYITRFLSSVYIKRHVE